MKSVIHHDGRIDLDGTPEELAAYELRRFVQRFNRLAFREWHGLPPDFLGYDVHIEGFESAEIGRSSALGPGVRMISCRCGAVSFDPSAPRPRLEVLHGEQHTPEACVAHQVNPDAAR